MGCGGSVRVGTAQSLNLPPYFADVIIYSTQPSVEEAEAAHRSLRPYGGEIHIGETDEVIVREGGLPGTDDWTHQYANATQTVVANDEHVKAPFGVLWFGGPSHEGILPRHGHGPSPQVAGGRLFIEGIDKLRAVDVYTGRLLWETMLPGFADYYNRTDHFAGAGEIGTNYVSLAESVYAVYGSNILELEAANGKIVRAFPAPMGEDGREAMWGFCLVSGDYLVGAAEPVGAVAAKVKSKGTLGKIADALEKVGAGATEAGVDVVGVIPADADWNYLTGSDPDKDTWKLPGEKLAAGWKSGKAGFGYGDDDDATVLTEMRNQFTRLYIQKSFDRSAIPDGANGLRLRVLFDDGFIAFLNGNEIARSNVTGSGKKGGSR